MRPVVVSSTQSHLWTDALHCRQLARQARNKWDRGTYVRACVSTAWTAIETSCQDALTSKDIGYRFKENLDAALAAKVLSAIDWSAGVWQQVRLLQERRKSYVHKFLALQDMFPDASVADGAVCIVRDAIIDIYRRTGTNAPDWTEIDQSLGWEVVPTLGMPTLSQAHAGSSFDDPNTTRVYIVIGGEEKLTSVFPKGHDASSTVRELLKSVKVPIQAIRVYDCGVLTQDLIVQMRGN